MKPHRTKIFTLSSDSFFIEKIRDIKGRFVNPPDHVRVRASIRNADPSPRTDPAETAHGSRLRGGLHTRLPAPWHDGRSRSVRELVNQIRTFTEGHSEATKQFAWAATAQFAKWSVPLHGVITLSTSASRILRSQ